ncbi:hypothetical protein WME76_08900 [Sorangium sp. So ce119]|uniref:hypothetical protein n=1 Tax=Sorangium sp. So ce119 TaxID=3133279 RepID=UPI003F601C49
MIAASTPACSCAADPGMVDPPIASGDGAGGDGGRDAAAGSGSGGEGQGGGAPIGASETVTAGEVAKSARYRMVFTLGQPAQNQETTTSPRYRMQGGLIGANGSSP